ncbi:MAG TPA: hypothetical protein VF402_03620 [Asticcacaulis sp.]
MGAAILLLLAAFGAGYLTRVFTARPQIKTEIRAAARAQKAETKLIVIHDKVAQAAKEAHDGIAGAAAQARPGCDESGVVSAWRDGLERVRQAAGAAADSAGGASAVPLAGPAQRQDDAGSGRLLDRAGTRADDLRSRTQGADQGD